MSEPSRWVFFAGAAHVLADDTTGMTNFLTVCAREVSFTTSVYRVAPSLNVCRICQRVSGVEAPPEQFPASPTVF